MVIVVVASADDAERRRRRRRLSLKRRETFVSNSVDSRTQKETDLSSKIAFSENSILDFARWDFLDNIYSASALTKQCYFVPTKMQ